MRALPFLAVFFIAACNETTQLGNAQCDQPCYDGPVTTRGIGACHDGHIVCIGTTTSCVDQVLPQDELCSAAQDLNCDGKIGGGLTSDPWVGAACGPVLGACEPGQLFCVAGVARCLGGVGPTEEDCSGRDLNCDGVPNNINGTVCYDGDAHDLLPGTSECRAGITACVGNAIACVGARYPMPEICGTGRDRNCNGVIDDVADLTHAPADVVIVLDRSLSMANKHGVIINALLDFIDMHADPQLFRYSYVEVPGDHWNQIQVYWPQFVSAEWMKRELQATIVAGYYGGVENSWDAFLRVGDGTYGHQYADGSRRFLLFFGDEYGQTDMLLTPRSERMAAVVDALHVNDVTFIGFIDLIYTIDYELFATETGGMISSVNQDKYTITNTLNSVFGSCIP